MTEAAFDLIIIGGGMAGLAAACAASANRSDGVKIGLIEKNALAGRKLLLAGSGQCNVTHAGEIQDFFPHYGGKERFVTPALLSFSNQALRGFLAEENVPTYAREDGKVFPKSMRGTDVLNAFMTVCRRNGVLFFGQTPIRSITKSDHLFRLETTGGTIFSAQRLIIAAGGNSFPKTGSTGDFVRWAETLGHEIASLHPALTPIYTGSWSYADCAGIALNSPRIELFHQGKKTNTFSGEILFTHRGLSGPAILDASRFIRPADELKIALIPFVDQEKWESAFQNALTSHPKRTIPSLLSDWGIPNRLARTLFLSKNLPLDATGAALRKEDRRKIIEAVYRWPFTVSRLGSWNEAMTTSGGIDLNGINRKTMESRLVPGLFFAGETLDIDGDCGGYNLQWAWSSGMLAGKCAVESNLTGK